MAYNEKDVLHHQRSTSWFQYVSCLSFKWEVGQRISLCRSPLSWPADRKPKSCVNRYWQWSWEWSFSRACMCTPRKLKAVLSPVVSINLIHHNMPLSKAEKRRIYAEPLTLRNLRRELKDLSTFFTTLSLLLEQGKDCKEQWNNIVRHYQASSCQDVATFRKLTESEELKLLWRPLNKMLSPFFIVEYEKTELITGSGLAATFELC